MDVIIFPGVKKSNVFKNNTVVKKETENTSTTKLLSQAFKALKERESK